MTECEETEIELLLREPEIVAWLEQHESNGAAMPSAQAHEPGERES